MAMSITAQNMLNCQRSHPFLTIQFSPKYPLKAHHPFFLPHCEKLQTFQFRSHDTQKRKLNSTKTDLRRVRAIESGGDIDSSDQRERQLNEPNLDSVLLVAEVLCIAPSVVFSISCALNSLVSASQKSVQSQLSLVNRYFVWQFVFLVGAVGIGAMIRRRQWQRICRDTSRSGSNSSFNIVERIEKLEEDVRSSATIVRVLSRQLEKLGIRFRVTRKALKEPITETAALAQKNSEATRALAIQEDILEKELGEIQKVLLAMQEQQQKQLDLILAIGKSGKLRDSRRASVAEEQMPNSVPKKEEVKQIEIQTERHKGRNNNRV